MSRVYKRGEIYWGAWRDDDGGSHRESLGTSNLKAAKARLAKREFAGSVQRVEPFTVQDALMLAGQVQVAKGNTQEWRDRCALIAEQHLLPILGADTDLNAVNIPELVDMYARTRRGQLTPKGKPPADANTRKELLIVRQGAAKGKVYKDFFGEPSELVPSTLTESPPRDVWLTPTRFADLQAKVTPHRRDWTGFAVHTGIDIGPIHRIHKERDIDFTQGEYGAVHIRDTKTRHRDRWVPLSADARDIVDRRMQTPHEMLFWPVWTSSQFRESMLRWCPKAGLDERIIWKDLRRTFCSWMCQAGVPMHHVIRLMGHGSSQMVERVYMHLAPETFEQAIARLPRVPLVYMDNVVQLEKHRENRDKTDEGRAESAY
ncbi:MAG: tyrosine-type recombinase/integrase [Deltaproteobacteria bacterium]|nr:tyrosine-type recombinase/integrase [Deltaproteobacteria bacterium]